MSSANSPSGTLLVGRWLSATSWLVGKSKGKRSALAQTPAENCSGDDTIKVLRPLYKEMNPQLL